VVSRFIHRSLAGIVTAGAIVALGSCVPLGGDCEADSDCGGEVCANDRQCLPPDRVIRVQVQWTIGGLPVSPADGNDGPCAIAGITELSVDFRDSDGDGPATDEGLGFRPVPCDLGRITYDRMPEWYDLLVLTAYGADGQLASVEAPIVDRDAIVDVDLRP
jgi:hypothetical protein